MQKSAIIIGSGIGGIATAIRLGKAGLKVSVFETNSIPGGKISELQAGGFRFDMGPTLFTLPEMIDDLLKLYYKNPDDVFEYVKLDVVCKLFYPDGTVIKSYSDTDAYAQEIKSVTGFSEAKIKNYLKKADRMYELTKDLFIFNEFKFPNFLIKKSVFKGILNWRVLQPFKTMHGYNKSVFKDPRLVQLFDRFATYNGSDPYKAPGTLALISHLEHNIGAYFPKKGMYSIVKALYQMALDAGVEFHFNTEVSRIILKNNKVTGVSVNNNNNTINYEADYIISNSDCINTYKYLGDQKKQLQLSKHPRSSSALIFYWGVKGNYPQFELHNILFSANYKEEFKCIFEKKIIYSDPTVYILISSKVVKSDAPKDCENWFVLINTPENSGQDWDHIIPKVRENILSKIKDMLGLDIAPLITYEKISDPRSIEAVSLAYKGALYGSNSNSKFAAFNRHPNDANKYKGLYFAGGTVHPGGGIPLCLSSANIVAKKIIKTL